MERYRCKVCGHIYDPTEGDPKSGIAPGAAFEDLPEDWLCPVCDAKKTKFQLVVPGGV
ncbi:rubredoxin [Nostoc sp. FACHB-892]|uniref:rubredoxin n=1 Tax=Nostoc sp. FACHB-892 TaxID=2692843 RepID=UPI0016823A22|nr:rubredoxin [Nostoc sp. FACHB-892]MBD2731695.1 rubredoxin [Nostoc sp. FACHB-892]